MAQSLSFLAVHLVFATKYRTKLIPSYLQSRLHAVIANLINQSGGRAIVVGGTADHVHAVFEIDRNTTVSSLVGVVKGRSSVWLSEEMGGSRKFQWQNGYGAFSVGRSQINTLKRYVGNQVQHHSKRDFRAEFVDMLNKYGVEYNDKYLPE